MSYCTFSVALAAPPTTVNVDGREVLEAFASINSQRDPVSVLLRVPCGTKIGSAFSSKEVGHRLIITGELHLASEKYQAPVVKPHSFCDATDSQYVNEVVVIGRLSEKSYVSQSGKSVSRSLAVNRYVSKDNQVTDWFNLRGFSYAKDRLEAASKGALCSIHGSLYQDSSDKGLYTGVNVRRMTCHQNSKVGKGGSNPAEGTSAVGYAPSDFNVPQDESPLSSDWN